MVRLSEVMSSNASAVKADNGQYSDWVEIVNTGVSDVSLKGYTLLNADDALAPLTFPDITLAPGEYLLIHCDGTLKNTAGYALHAPFRLSAAGVTLGLYDAEGARVDAVDVPGLERNHVYRRNQQNGAWEVSGDYTPGLPIRWRITSPSMWSRAIVRWSSPRRVPPTAPTPRTRRGVS